MSGGQEISFSVEETNKIREGLGLKPLQVDDDSNDVGKPGTAKMENDVLVAPVVPSEKKAQEAMREKLATQKEKRKREKKLSSVKGLAAEADDDQSATAWLKKSKSKRIALALAAKKEKELAALDDQLDEPLPEYTAKDLAGLSVKHTKEDIQEGEQMVLTLADSSVLDGDDDVLENVNLNDAERTKEALEAKKGIKEYKAYEDDEFDQFGKPKDKSSVLKKYDNIDVLTGDEKKPKAEGFTLDGTGGADTEHERKAKEIRENLKRQMQDLDYEVKKGGTDFYTTEEMAQFKKKKKRKIRKKSKALKADDLEAMQDFSAPVRRDAETGGVAADGAATMLQVARAKSAQGENDASSTTSKPSSTLKLDEVDLEVTNADEDAMMIDINNVEDDEAEAAAAAEIESTMKRARQIARKKKNRISTDQLVAKNSTIVKSDGDEFGGGGEAENATAVIDKEISINQVEEVVKLVVRKEQEAKAKKAEERRLAAQAAVEAPTDGGAAGTELGTSAATNENAMEVDNDEKGWRQEVKEKAENINEPEIDDDYDDWKSEANTNRGLMATLQFSKMRGFLDEKKSGGGAAANKTGKTSSSGRSDDRRADRRDDRSRDPFHKAGYKPAIKLEYRDDSGRLLEDQKEIFRYISHKFHGKGSGKSKMEKRQMKLLESEASKKMDSGDTPLSTTEIMRSRMESSGTAHVVIQGSSLHQPQLKKKSKKK